MRILVLCKRQYTGRDLLDDRYGRLHELPGMLASLGHRVTVMATSYRPRSVVNRLESGVSWRSINALPRPWAVPAAWRVAARQIQPDLILGSSDAIHLVGARRLAKALGLPYAVDLYDDYEAFGLTRLPGLLHRLRRACSEAQAVFAVSNVLAGLMAERGLNPDRVHVLPNGVPETFVPNTTPMEARERLGLPQGVALVGTAGALDHSRGILDLFRAVQTLRESLPQLRLVLAGPLAPATRRQLPENSIVLGERTHAEVALLFRALDVGVVCNRDTAFARACHPMKLVELVACGTPVVAADVGEVSRLLSGRPDALYVPGDHRMLAARIQEQLRAPRPLETEIARTWQDLAGILEAALEAITARPQIGPAA
jgi:glycosyltransferase involved in cell wall biosynthesis